MAPSTRKDPLQIAIVGGGIGGLALLIGLLNHTDSAIITPHLYESAPKFAEIGAGVAFGPNAVRAMKAVDPRLHEAYLRIAARSPTVEVDGKTRIAWHHFLMGMDGRTSRNKLKAMDEVCTPYSDNPTHNVHRAAFLDEMLKLLGDRKEQYTSFGKRLKDIEDLGSEGGVTIHFEDGSSAYADAVIGCDGVKSRVRQILLADQPKHLIEPQFTTKYAYRGLIPMDDAVAAIGERAKVNLFLLGYGGHLVTFPIDQGRTFNIVAFHSAPEGKWTHGKDWVVPATVEDALNDFKDWSDPVKKLLGMLKKPDKWGIFDHPPAPTYHRGGKILLLGDCAHASSPHQGAGAGMAIEDAAVLSNLMAQVKTLDYRREPLADVFAAHDQSRQLRSQNLVTTSRDMGFMIDFQKEGIEDDVEKLTELSATRFRWLWQHEVEVECKSAIELFNKLSECRELGRKLQRMNTNISADEADRIKARLPIEAV